MKSEDNKQEISESLSFWIGTQKTPSQGSYVSILFKNRHFGIFSEDPHEVERQTLASSEETWGWNGLIACA